jgi:8-oxo-dGTP diphosphatase
MDAEVAKIYGQKVRVRVCGLCWQGGDLLLVNHRGVTSGDFWAPPGGGIEFGQSIEQTLRREFLEETGLTIRVGEFMFGCEFIRGPLHAIELFHEVFATAGELRAGRDPEIQIIRDARYMSNEDVRGIPQKQLHGVFQHVDKVADLKDLKGFLRI